MLVVLRINTEYTGCIIGHVKKKLSRKKAAKKVGKELKPPITRAVRRFIEAYESKLEKYIQDGDQPGFYKHLKGMDKEG